MKYDIFGSPAKSRRKDVFTSFEAAIQVDTNTLEMEVYAVIKGHPEGCIMDDVISALPHIREHSIQPRFAPLIRKGFVVDTGEKRKGKSGRYQRIMRIKDDTTRTT